MRRAQEEIVARYRARVSEDVFGFECQDYFLAMDVSHAAEFLGDGTDVSDWAPKSAAEIDKQAKDYMSFWLEKIENERSLSVVRATMHFIAWKWLLGHPDADTFPGASEGPSGGWYQRDAYEYIKQQMDSGEWDAMTRGAV